MIKGHASFLTPTPPRGHHFIYQRKLKAFKKKWCKHLSYFAYNVFSHVYEVNWQTEHGTRQSQNLPGVEGEKVQGLLGVVNLLGKFGGAVKSAGSYQKRSILGGQLEVLKKTVQ